MAGTGVLLPLTPSNNYASTVLLCGGSKTSDSINPNTMNSSDPASAQCSRMTLTTAGIAAGWAVESMPTPRIMPDAVSQLLFVKSLNVADVWEGASSGRARADRERRKDRLLRCVPFATIRIYDRGSHVFSPRIGYGNVAHQVGQSNAGLCTPAAPFASLSPDSDSQTIPISSRSFTTHRRRLVHASARQVSRLAPSRVCTTASRLSCLAEPSPSPAAIRTATSRT